MITNELLDALERRYLPADQQKCVVCGAPLQFSSSGSYGSGARYNCSSDDASPLRSTKPFRERIEHWDRSTWYDRELPNMGVVELVRAYRELVPPTAVSELEQAVQASGLMARVDESRAHPERMVPLDLDVIEAVADNTGDGDRWEDPRDTVNGSGLELPGPCTDHCRTRQ
jgi:hypothetical protein